MADESRGVVRVGVRRWDADRPAEPGGPANCMIGPLWVEVDGVRIPGEVLLHASHAFESDGDEAQPGFGMARFAVICSDYRLVDVDADGAETKHEDLALSEVAPGLVEVLRPLVDEYGALGVGKVARAIARESV